MTSEKGNPEKQADFPVRLILIGLLISSALYSTLLVDASLLPRALAVSVLSLAGIVLVCSRKLKPISNGWEFAFLLFYAWNLISSFWATSPAEAIIQSQLVFLGMTVCWIFRSLLLNFRETEKLIIQVQILVLAYSFALSLNTMLGLEYYNPYSIVSLSINNNLYSSFLLLSLPLLWRGYSLFRGFWRYAALLTAVLVLFFIIIVQSRAVYAGLAVAILLLGFALILRYRRLFSKHNLIMGFGSAMLLALLLSIFHHSLDATRRNAFASKLAVWNYISPHKTETAVANLPAPAAMENTKSSLQIPEEYYENVNTRLIFWQKSLGLIKTTPLQGVGAGNWKLRVAGIAEPPNPELLPRNFTYSQPHNEWIAILSELGIIGFLLAFIVLILPLLILFLKLLTGKQQLSSSAAAIGCVLAGFLVSASFDFPFHRVEHLVLMFLLYALLLRELPVDSFPFRKLQIPLWSRFPGIFLMIATLFSILVFSFRISGEANTLKFFRQERKNDAAVVRYSSKALNRFYTLTPNTLPVKWFEGVAQYRLGNPNKAMDCFRQALKTAPYEVRTWNDYGTALYSSGQKAAAVTAFQKALEIDRFFDDPRYNLSAIYFESARYDSALYYLNQCRDSEKKRTYLEEIGNKMGRK
ncbi:MAG: O-antigen ligase family protein [Bacteroidales bacterium]|nr:O-antigen ligase family protein [Bacteroidales bacterium]